MPCVVSSVAYRLKAEDVPRCGCVLRCETARYLPTSFVPLNRDPQRNWADSDRINMLLLLLTGQLHIPAATRTKPRGGNLDGSNGGRCGNRCHWCGCQQAALVCGFWAASKAARIWGWSSSTFRLWSVSTWNYMQGPTKLPLKFGFYPSAWDRVRHVGD